MRQMSPTLLLLSDEKSGGNDKREALGVTGIEDIAGSVLTDGQLPTPVSISDPTPRPKLTILFSIPGENILQQQPAHHPQSPPR